MDPRPCPKCSKPMETQEGRLSQAGRSYLPAIVSFCPKCEIKRWDPKPGATWVALKDNEPDI